MSYTIECDRCGKTMYADSRSKEGDYHSLSINYGKKTVHLCRKCFDIFMQSILHDSPTIIESEGEDVSSHIRQLAGQAGKILVDAALNAIKESEGSERQ